MTRRHSPRPSRPPPSSEVPLGYKWVVWDHADTKVSLTQGDHVITLAARSLDGAKATKGDAIVDRVTLALPNPAAAQSIYEAGYATLSGARVGITPITW